MRTSSPTRTDPCSSPPGRLALTQDDWDFSPDGVPNEELIPCLLWEFLRESPTAQTLGRDWSAWIKRCGELRAHGENEPDQRPLWKRLSALQPAINKAVRLDDFLCRTVVQAWGFKGLAQTPWQRLSPQAKDFLSEPCVYVNKPVFVGFGLHASDLAQSMAELDRKASDKPPDGGVLHLPSARAPLRFFGEATQEAFCIVVDWGRYDNTAIQDAFAKLAHEIITTRPEGVQSQTWKGSGAEGESDWRSKLQNIGLTRLYAAHSGVSGLRRTNSKAYDFIQSLMKNQNDDGPTAVQKKLTQAKKLFEGNFHKVLPFEKAAPICLSRSRFGGR